MNRTLRRVLIGVAIFVAVLVGAGSALHVAGAARMANGAKSPVQAVAIPTDEASLRRGEHLDRAVVGCTSCHGADLRGEIMIDDSTFGRIVAPNLTSGSGGFAADATVEDWVRALKHGVGRDGRVLAVMPSDAYAHLSDADLGAVLVYVTSFAPVDNVLPPRRLVFPGTALAGFMMFDDLPVSRIARMAPPTFPAEGADADYGTYLLSISTCRDCHGQDLRGLAPGTPGPPPGPDLSRNGALAAWSEADFVHALRAGIAPGGRVLSADMPFAVFGRMTDGELSAIWAALEEVR
jgi:hypothetical protein